jgi:hypothetical protein
MVKSTREEEEMQYLAMIYGDEDRWESFSPEERREVYKEYESFAEQARQAGVLVGGAELDSTSTATTVRVRDGETLVTDGPFAELKEALGGYFLLECASLEDACRWAARIPGATHGAIEVRPLYVDPSADGGGAS